MREFDPPVSPELRQQIIDLVVEILERASKVKPLYGRDFAMDAADAYVGARANLDLGEEIGSISLAQAEPGTEPPFEWIVEVTSEIGESEYLRHYLVRENDVVLAHRKVLTEVDDKEATSLIDDLKMALATL
jgi:hypothetical protein